MIYFLIYIYSITDSLSLLCGVIGIVGLAAAIILGITAIDEYNKETATFLKKQSDLLGKVSIFLLLLTILFPNKVFIKYAIGYYYGSIVSAQIADIVANSDKLDKIDKITDIYLNKALEDAKDIEKGSKGIEGNNK